MLQMGIYEGFFVSEKSSFRIDELKKKNHFHDKLIGQAKKAF